MRLVKQGSHRGATQSNQSALPRWLNSCFLCKARVKESRIGTSGAGICMCAYIPRAEAARDRACGLPRSAIRIAGFLCRNGTVVPGQRQDPAIRPVRGGAAERLLDASGALIALILLAPLMILPGLARLLLGIPVLHRQVNDRTFDPGLRGPLRNRSKPACSGMSLRSRAWAMSWANTTSTSSPNSPTCCTATVGRRDRAALYAWLEECAPRGMTRVSC